MTPQSERRYRLPGGLAAFRRTLGYVGVVELYAAVISFTAAVILNLIQIFLRFAFEGSIWWAQEISLLLMMIAYYIGISCIFRLRHYVVIHFFVERLSPRKQVFFYLFAQVLTIVFCSIVLYKGVINTPQLLTTYSVILHYPEFYWTLPLLLASASMIATTVYYGLAVLNASAHLPGAALPEIEDEVQVHRELAIR